MVKYLIEHGADINYETSDGINSIFDDSLRSYKDNLNYLMENEGKKLKIVKYCYL